MIIPNTASLELNAPSDPQWLSNNTPHTLVDVDLGQFVVTVYKSTDRVIHVYAEAVFERRAVRIEIPITFIDNRPPTLMLSWDAEAICLHLDGEPPISLPWQAYPLPPRL